MLLIIAILIAIVVWWYGEDLFLTKEEEKLVGAKKNVYDVGSLNPNLTGQTIATGCTDSEAYNYNPQATEDDGSCIFKIGCCDINATNYDAEADSCHLPDNNVLCDYGAGINNTPNQRTKNQLQGCANGLTREFGLSADKLDWYMGILLWEDLNNAHCMVKTFITGWGGCDALCENGTPADDPNYQAPFINPASKPPGFVLQTEQHDGISCGIGINCRFSPTHRDNPEVSLEYDSSTNILTINYDGTTYTMIQGTNQYSGNWYWVDKYGVTHFYIQNTGAMGKTTYYITTYTS